MARTILDEVMGIRPDLIEHNWRTRCATQTGVLTTGRLICRNVE
jgi:hypothetical protein